MNKGVKKNKLVRILRIVMPLIGLCCLVIFTPWNAFWLWITPLPDSVQEQIDASVDHGLQGVIVYVDQQDYSPDTYAAGWKNIENKESLSENDLFKIASISKLYIAAAAVKLIADQGLSLDDTLTDFFPDLDGRIEHADEITLKLLLQHRSGIPNFTDQEKFDWSVSHSDIDECLKIILDMPADFMPDSRYRYSNTNYLLIGKILDKELGYSHMEFIRNEILAPLGLTNTFGQRTLAPFEIVSGYNYPYDQDLALLDYDIPGGSMVATAREVGIFLRALNEGTIFTQSEYELYSTLYRFDHSGWLPGYHSTARYREDIDAVVVLFVNTTGGYSEMLSNLVFSRIEKILYERADI